MSILEIIESLKWPVIILFGLRTIEKMAAAAAAWTDVAGKFADRDSIAIARMHATAIAHGTLVEADEAGHQSLLSYLPSCS